MFLQTQVSIVPSDDLFHPDSCTANNFDNMESLQETVRLRRWDEAVLVPQLHIPWMFDESDDLANKTLMEMMAGCLNCRDEIVVLRCSLSRRCKRGILP